MDRTNDLLDRRFQQDVATCHTARVTVGLLRGEFGENLISRSGPVNWPPISCDLMPLDYFLLVFVKAYVYTDSHASIDALEDNIEAFINVNKQNSENPQVIEDRPLHPEEATV